MKLIVFTDPIKFSGLIDKKCKCEQFNNAYKDYAHNDRHINWVTYVKDDGSFKMSNFEEQLANEHSVLIIEDIFNEERFVNYIKDKTFIILRHSAEPFFWGKLKPQAQGVIQELEEEMINQKETHYFKLAKFIGNSDGIKVKDILTEMQSNSKIENKLESVLEFLYGCLDGYCDTGKLNHEIYNQSDWELIIKKAEQYNNLTSFEDKRLIIRDMSRLLIDDIFG